MPAVDPDELVFAGAARDAAGRSLRPAVAAIGGGRMLGVAPPGAFEARHRVRVRSLPDRLLLPPMVNAHAHLDLSGLSPAPYDGDFPAWLERVRRDRPSEPAAIHQAVRAGAAAAHAAGVGWVGDIAGTVSAVRALWRTRLGGVSHLECFGLETDEAAAREHLERMLAPLPLGPAVGIEPHAPYSAGLGTYRAAAAVAKRRGHRLATHLAESPEEVSFVQNGAGPLVHLLERIGKRPAALRGSGRHPVDWLAPVLEASGPWLLAHGHETTPAHWARLAAWGASVAYCPMADAYFGRAGHPYQGMRDAGLNVVLGTDGAASQPPHARQPLGVLDGMRRLFRSDGADPGSLLAMATTDGLRALGIAPELATLGPGGAGDLVLLPFDPSDATDPLEQALARDDPAERLSRLSGAA